MLIVSAAPIAGYGQTATEQQRPPAVPLVAYDPYFSVWSMADKLTDENTKHWTGTEQPLTGLVRIDGANYRYMGVRPRHGVPAMRQVSVSVTPTHTVYTFNDAGVRLVLTFFTPAFPEDLDLLSRPVTYLTWDVAAVDGKKHDISIYFDVDPVFAVNTNDQQVTWSRARAGSLTVLNAGSRDQRVLDRAGDNLRIDWGYCHLAVPDNEHAMLANAADASNILRRIRAQFPASDDFEMPKEPSRNSAAHLTVVFPIANVGSQTVSRHVLLSYTEGYAIEYLNRKLRPYWQRNGQTPQEMLEAAEAQFRQLEQRGKQFDAELTDRPGASGWQNVRAISHVGVSPDPGRAWLGRGYGWDAAAVPQGELQQRLYLDRRCHLSVCAIFPVFQSSVAGGAIKAGAGVRRAAALEMAVCAT